MALISPPRLRRVPASDLLVALILAALYVSIALWSVPATGVTWDETRYIAQAKARTYSLYSMATGKPDLFFCDLTAEFELTRGVNEESAEWASRCWEGRPKLSVTMSGISWAVIWFLNGGSLDVISSIMAHRLAIILLTAIGLLAVYFFIKDAYNRRAAVFSVLSIIFIPRFFAHSRYVLMDEPVVIFWVLTLWFFWLGLKNWKYGLLSGVMLGLALATKAQAVFIPFIIIFWLLVSYRDKVVGAVKALFKKKVPGIAANFLSMVFVTPFVWLMSWPWLWHNTMNRFVWWTWYYLGTIKEGAPPVYFLGEVVRRPSFLYIFSLAAATIPLPILIFAILGGWIAVKDTINLSNRLSFLFLISALTQLLVLSLSGIAYNGVQQFVQSFLFIGILSGIGADSALNHAKIPSFLRKRQHTTSKASGQTVRWQVLLTIVVAGLLVAPGCIAILKGHTDTYFNLMVGGTGGVYNSGLYETVWSGEPYLEVVYWLNGNAVENAKIYVPMAHNIFNTYKYGDIGQIKTRFNVTSGGLGQFSFEQDALLRDDIEIISYYDAIDRPETMQDVDYVVLMSRSGLFENEGFIIELTRKCMEHSSPVYSVIADSAPVVRVYQTPCD